MKNTLPLEGLWWTPEHPENRSAGRLAQEDDAVYLHLTVENFPQLGPSPREAPLKYQVIHGLTYTGKPVTLLDCFEISSHGTWGVELRSILVNHVLIGGHVPPSGDGRLFSEMILEWPDLRRWFLHSGIKVQHRKRQPCAFTLKYEPRKPVKAKLSDDLHLSFHFGTDALPVASWLTDRVSFRDLVWVVAKPSVPHDLCFFLDLAEELKHFFSICCLEQTEPSQINLVGSFHVGDYGGHTAPPHLELYREHAYQPKAERVFHPMNFLVPYDAVGDALPEVLQRWHSFTAKTSPAARLYFSSLYRPGQYLEATFLSLVQSAEVLHRRSSSGTYLPKEQYEADVLPKMKAAIPGFLTHEVRESLVGKLAFLNELSLRKRLKLMIQQHEQVFRKYVPETENMVRGIVEARNYYTHYSSPPPTGWVPRPKDLFLYIDILRVLIELEMMSGAGVELSTLHKCALETQRYRWLFPPERRST